MLHLNGLDKYSIIEAVAGVDPTWVVTINDPDVYDYLKDAFPGRAIELDICVPKQIAPGNILLWRQYPNGEDISHLHGALWLLEDWSTTLEVFPKKFLFGKLMQMTASSYTYYCVNDNELTLELNEQFPDLNIIGVDEAPRKAGAYDVLIVKCVNEVQQFPVYNEGVKFWVVNTDKVSADKTDKKHVAIGAAVIVATGIIGYVLGRVLRR